MTRIIITRPAPDAERFAELCVTRGFEPVLAPMMRIELLPVEIANSGFGALAFTSANGVRAFAAQSDCRDTPAFCVGETTAAEAAAAGFGNVTAAAGDVESLADVIAGAGLSVPVLHVAGSDRAGDLVAALAARGVVAERCVAYKAVATAAMPLAARRALTDHTDDIWIVFFSPRTARIFLHLAEAAALKQTFSAAHAACLSDAVAAELADAGFAAVRIAARRDAASLLDLVAR